MVDYVACTFISQHGEITFHDFTENTWNTDITISQFMIVRYNKPCTYVPYLGTY